MKCPAIYSGMELECVTDNGAEIDNIQDADTHHHISDSCLAYLSELIPE